MQKNHEIAAFLTEHNGFSEGVIEEFSVNDYGTTFEVRMSYGWAKRNAGGDPAAPEYITLKFRLVQELHLTNALTPAMLTSPESLNWGINEVAVVKLLDSYTPLRNERTHPDFHQVAFLWEGERRIVVVFQELEVIFRE